MSVDLLPSTAPGPHIEGDVLQVISQMKGIDLLVAHPPCTYLASMGIWWNRKRPERWNETFKAKDFVEKLWHCGIPRIAIENPIGYLSNHWRKPSQIINPWQFGQTAHKPTCLWLKGLPKLSPTKIVDRGAFYTKANGTRISVWSHTLSGTSEDRARLASQTFRGIADAMAIQWGMYVEMSGGSTVTEGQTVRELITAGN